MNYEILTGYLQQCDSCQQVRVYLVADSVQQGINPNLVFVNVENCHEYYGADSLVLYVSTDTNQLAKPDGFEERAQNWLDILAKADSANRTIWAYTFDRATFYNAATDSLGNVLMEYAYHTNMHLRLSEPVVGKMIFDMVVRNAESKTYEDFASPCPYICGDGGVMRSFYPALSLGKTRKGAL